MRIKLTLTVIFVFFASTLSPLSGARADVCTAREISLAERINSFYLEQVNMTTPAFNLVSFIGLVDAAVRDGKGSTYKSTASQLATVIRANKPKGANLNKPAQWPKIVAVKKAHEKFASAVKKNRC